MSGPKKFIDHKITRKDRDELERGTRVQVILHPGDFGIVPKRLGLEGLTISEVYQVEQRLKNNTTLQLCYHNQSFAKAKCVGMRYKRPNLYAIYAVVELGKQDAVKKNGIPPRE